ncbi:hypothetical protein QFZ65_002478 [Arthrobacter sp. B3I9]|nr:hypothetical protein [Arthrobacter sp. B3I9]
MSTEASMERRYGKARYSTVTGSYIGPHDAVT